MSRRLLPDVLGQKLDMLRPAGDGWTARCPAHEDRSPSLSVTLTADDKVLLHCHAGCLADDVMAALGITWTDLPARETQDRTKADEWTPHGPATAVYEYRDEQGALLFQVLRTADKQFPQRRPDPSRKSGWNWSLGDTRRVPYRLPQLMQAVADGKPVWITEGEKDVHALLDAGQAATCNPGGAGKWRAEYVDHFRDAYVTVCADADKPGRAHARTVAASLEGVARAVRVVEAAEGYKDMAAHLFAGRKLNEVLVTHAPDSPAKPDLAPDIHELLALDLPEQDFLIPGLLEIGDRLILTGFEGYGKSMLVRQIAVCAAAGINPFTFSRTGRPLKVLLIDAENSIRQTRRKSRGIVEAAAHNGTPVPSGGLRVLLEDNIDLTRDEDEAWLLERVTAHRPDLLLIGPLYKLYAGKPEEEQTLRRVTNVIDKARAIGDGCAVVIEHHVPHGEGLMRTTRPIGSSLLLRWPEFGLGLKPTEATDPKTRSPLELVAWRGGRDERDWPDGLEHGRPGEMPWIEHLPGFGRRSAS